MFIGLRKYVVRHDHVNVLGYAKRGHHFMFCPSGYYGKSVKGFESCTEGTRSQTWRIAGFEVFVKALLKIREFCDTTIFRRATS